MATYLKQDIIEKLNTIIACDGLATDTEIMARGIDPREVTLKQIHFAKLALLCNEQTDFSSSYYDDTTHMERSARMRIYIDRVDFYCRSAGVELI